MKKITHIFFVLLIVIFALFASGCSGIEGYSVLLWSIPEHNLSDGDVVPVYFKSNISKVYVIGVPSSADDAKIEIPLWQITEPSSKKKATEHSQDLAEYKYQYAKVKIDGLAIREEPVNTADQVYRLRESETIKLLYKGEGQPVMRGNTPLEGDWMRVLTSDGTVGWCFTYNLTSYDEREGFHVEIVDTDGEKDEIVQAMAKEKWYPSYYRDMIASGRINLSRMGANFTFDPGLTSGTITIINEDVNQTFAYNGITRKNNITYSFNDTPVMVNIHAEDFITVEYLDEIGRRVAYDYASFDDIVVPTENSETTGEAKTINYISKIIEDEVARRQALYEKILNLSEDYYSSSYGSLNLTYDNNFTWRSYQRLADANVIGLPSVTESTGRGTVTLKHFISNELANDFDGVLSFRFVSSNEDLNLFYKIEENGIRFETVGNFNKETSFITQRSDNPLVMFFNKQ